MNTYFLGGRKKLARNKKEGEQRSLKVTVLLDEQTKYFWDKRNERQNMSKWVRDQVSFHFCSNLSGQEEQARLREEILILKEQNNKRQICFEGEIAWRVKRYKELEPQDIPESLIKS